MAQQLSGNDLQGWDGYIALPLTPVYGSATTFTYPADLTGILDAGDKIKVTNNGSTKYFYVLPPVIFSAGSTTVTITGGSDYSLVNAGSPVMASLYYSKMATPHGFPQWFNYTPSFTGYSVNPTTDTARFNLVSRMCTVQLHYSAGGTSNTTGFTVSLPVTSASTSNTYSSMPNGADNGGATSGSAAVVGSGTTATMIKGISGTGNNWTAASSKWLNGIIVYEF